MTRLGGVTVCLKMNLLSLKNYVCYRDGVYPVSYYMIMLLI